MPRTLKSKWARSYAYKRNKEQRGWQKIEDKASHHSHRNMNIGANEITFTKFDCKFDRRLIANYGGGNVRVHNPADLQYELEGYDWKKETVVEFLLRKIQEQEGASFRNSSDKKRCLAGLKQLDRRGDNKRFVSHGRRFKQLDELN